jgi:hypothetical protein
MVTTDTTGMTFTCTAISGGGTNSNSTTIKRDATPPTANLAVTSGTPGSNGWYVSNVTVSTSGTDTISGPVSCTADQTLTADTSGQAFAGSCTNLAGLTTSAATLTVKRDATPPTASLAVTGGTLGNGGWYVSDVTLTTSGADTVSGPVACTPSQTLTMDTSGQVFAGSCTNLAGLSTSASPLTVKLDKSAPTIAITSPTSGAEYSLNQAVTASYTCTDTLSGIAAAGCTGSVSSGTNLDTASVGTKTFAVTAVDAAGNTATQSLTYTVSCHVVTISASPSPVTQGGFVTVRTTLTSCGAPTQTIALRFTLSGPPQSVGCFSVNSTIFTTGSFVLPANTQQTFTLPALWIPTLLCPGTYSITATTLIAGQPVYSVTTTLVVIHG